MGLMRDHPLLVLYELFGSSTGGWRHRWRTKGQLPAAGAAFGEGREKRHFFFFLFISLMLIYSLGKGYFNGAYLTLPRSLWP